MVLTEPDWTHVQFECSSSDQAMLQVFSRTVTCRSSLPRLRPTWSWWSSPVKETFSPGLHLWKMPPNGGSEYLLTDRQWIRHEQTAAGSGSGAAGPHLQSAWLCSSGTSGRCSSTGGTHVPSSSQTAASGSRWTSLSGCRWCSRATLETWGSSACCPPANTTRAASKRDAFPVSTDVQLGSGSAPG